MREKALLLTDNYRHIIERKFRTCRDVASPAVIGKEAVQTLAAHTGGQHHWAVKEGPVRAGIRQLHHPQAHRELNLDFVSLPPVGGNGKVTVADFRAEDIVTVDAEFHFLGVCPLRDPELDGKKFAAFRIYPERYAVVIREICFLLQFHVFPLEGGRDEEVHIEGSVGLVAINHFPVAGVVLHT